MKFFWWGATGPGGAMPMLFSGVVDDSGILKDQQTHYSYMNDIKGLLGNGFMEVSTETAYALGLPT